jgi:hypothetical protein
MCGILQLLFNRKNNKKHYIGNCVQTLLSLSKPTKTTTAKRSLRKHIRLLTKDFAVFDT